MTLYKIINVSPIQEHPYQTRYMAVPSKKRCKQSSLDGFFKKQRIDSNAKSNEKHYKMKECSVFNEILN